MQSKRMIIQTTDGSHTIRNELTGDTYHSIHGALQESQHVFLRNGLEFFLRTHQRTRIKILEIGFGTGLNALLTLQKHPEIQIEYMSIEPYPLESDVFEQLNYNGRELLLELHRCPWTSEQPITTNFRLTKLQVTLEQAILPNDFFDVVYFDAFAPNSQPELWSPQAFQKVYDSMAKQSLLVTYCAKGQVKRDLKGVGFIVASIPGPPGKREMVQAFKQS